MADLEFVFARAVARVDADTLYAEQGAAQDTAQYVDKLNQKYHASPFRAWLRAGSIATVRAYQTSTDASLHPRSNIFYDASLLGLRLVEMCSESEVDKVFWRGLSILGLADPSKNRIVAPSSMSGGQIMAMGYQGATSVSDLTESLMPTLERTLADDDDVQVSLVHVGFGVPLFLLNKLIDDNEHHFAGPVNGLKAYLGNISLPTFDWEAELQQIAPKKQPD